MDQIQIAREFRDELACMQFIELQRWPKGVRCVRCGREASQFTSWTAAGDRYLYQCRNPRCRYQFRPATGTLFHKSRVPLQKWFHAIALALTAEEGLSVREVQRELRISYKTAWYLCHRIRAALHSTGARLIPGGGPRADRGAKHGSPG